MGTSSCADCSTTAGRSMRRSATSLRRSGSSRPRRLACGETGSGRPRPTGCAGRRRRPEEMYNLAGESSVAGSFANPRANWEANAHVVVHLLDAIRSDSPETRFYQASSGEMFGWVPGGQIVHDELSPLNPQSPYAAAKAAAHLLCRSYRESYDVRIACGILFNHESHRRGDALPDPEGGRPCRRAAARRGRIAAPGRQPQGQARLGLRSRLRRGDDADSSAGVHSRRSGRSRASTATTSSAQARFTTSGS